MGVGTPSLLIAVVVAVAAFVCGVPAAKDSVALGSGIASVAATMLGFMLAVAAILASISGTHLVKMMHRTGHYQDLIRTLLLASFGFLVCVVAGFALMFGAPAGEAAMAVVVGLHAGALIAFLIAGRRFWLVLSNLKPGDL